MYHDHHALVARADKVLDRAVVDHHLLVGRLEAEHAPRAKGDLVPVELLKLLLRADRERGVKLCEGGSLLRDRSAF